MEKVRIIGSVNLDGNGAMGVARGGCGPVLLVGGTSDSVVLARHLVAAGCEVLVSQATEAALDYPASPLLRVRRGRLGYDGFRRLLAEERCTRLLDASHPFARELHSVAACACRDAGVPRLRYERPVVPLPDWVEVVTDHQTAADRAFERSDTVLITTGSRFLAIYADAARRYGGRLWARLLPCLESHNAVADCGLSEERIVWGRGPFPVADTVELLRRSGAGILVVKDAGTAGGLEDRLAAARLVGVAVIALRRPTCDPESVDNLEEALTWALRNS
jgi:precorrin-6A/cobalt-precorrin-6A reductase